MDNCFDITIERMANCPASVGHLPDGKAVFVEGAAPGDAVRVRIHENKRDYARATIVELLEASDAHEGKPLCQAACGGCPWRHVAYETQLAAKRDTICFELRKQAGLGTDDAEALVQACIPSPSIWHYRNKLELSCGTDAAGKLVLGLHQDKSAEVEPIASCPLAHEKVESAPKALSGALRYLASSMDSAVFRVGVRHSTRTGDLEIALWSEPSGAQRGMLAKTLRAALPYSSLVRVLAKPGKERKVSKVEVLDGKGFWEEELHGIGFRTSAPSFFQVNTEQAETLIDLVVSGLGDVDGMAIADLYSGGGTFALALAQHGADVIAVESAGTSVRDLRRNADDNDLPIDVIGGDSARELEGLGALDALVVDPPRAGLAKGVVESIAATQAHRVAYVSCDPATWARDAKRFMENGYALERVTPVDLFPQTYHVELVSIFAKKR